MQFTPVMPKLHFQFLIIINNEINYDVTLCVEYSFQDDLMNINFKRTVSMYVFTIFI